MFKSTDIPSGFPLRAKKGGVLRRAGHTEATVDLARLAGFAPAGVLVEIMNEDGSMARLPELRKIAKKFDVNINFDGALFDPVTREGDWSLTPR